MADPRLTKLAFFQRVGRMTANTGEGALSGLRRLLFGKRVTTGPYADAARKKVEAQGREFKGIYRVPRKVNLDKKKGLTDPKKWKTVTKQEYDTMRASGNFPEQHFADYVVPGTKETVYKVRQMGFDPKSVSGFVGRHPGKVLAGTLGVGLMWDPVTQTYKRSVDTMSGRGVSRGGYYYPSQGA